MPDNDQNATSPGNPGNIRPQGDNPASTELPSAGTAGNDPSASHDPFGAADLRGASDVPGPPYFPITGDDPAPAGRLRRISRTVLLTGAAAVLIALVGGLVGFFIGHGSGHDRDGSRDAGSTTDDETSRRGAAPECR